MSTFTTRRLSFFSFSAMLSVLVAFATIGGCKGDGGGDSTVTDCTSDEECPNGACVAGECTEDDVTTDVDTDVDSEVGPDGDAEVDGDGGSDGETGDCSDGAYQCPCEDNEDCSSGFCIGPDRDRACSLICGSDGDCGEGWECRPLGIGDEFVPLCVPLQAIQCNPCEDAQVDCEGIAICGSLLDGDFCLAGCDDSEDCGEGFSCVGVTVDQGGSISEVPSCVPNTNTCGKCYDPDGDFYGIGPDCAESGEDCNPDDPNVFPGAAEICDGKDNNCDGGIDEDFVDGSGNYVTDDRHCGFCFNNCDDPSVIPNIEDGICDAGLCKVSSCKAPFLDCDGNDFDCEADSSSDNENCGGCDVNCGRDFGVDFTCQAGTCSQIVCEGALATCPGDTVACATDTSTNPNNCGACGTLCGEAFDNAAAQCSDSTCEFTSCSLGWLDCGGGLADGCETLVGARADGATSGPALNCGTCGQTCGDLNTATNDCVYDEVDEEFACEIVCDSPYFSDCNGDPSDGCEVDLRSPEFCGSCDGTRSCVGLYPNGEGLCDATADESDPETYVCELGDCDDLYLDCDPTAAGCESLKSDQNTCGGCGCVNPNPSSGFGCFDCDEVTDETTFSYQCQDVAAQGDAPSYACENTGCQQGSGICEGFQGCVDLTLDGTCGGGCVDCTGLPNALAATCVGDAIDTPARCQITQCDEASGYCDIDGVGNNGCEVNINEPRTCAQTCSEEVIDCVDSLLNVRGPYCNLGTCDFGSCSAGFVDCDAGNADEVAGCESQVSALSTCGPSCNNCQELMDSAEFHVENSTCNAQFDACRIVTCEAGWEDCDGDFTNGCETQLNTVGNCGGCGRTCSSAGTASGTLACNDDVPGAEFCEFACDPDFGDCNAGLTNGDIDGCEQPIDDSTQNCGECGNVCVFNAGIAACEDGTCKLAACTRGFADCDGNDECDDLTSAESCGAACRVCRDQQNVSDASCIDTSSGTVFSARCDVAQCDAGYCDFNGNGNDGCEIDINSPTTCGSGCDQAFVNCEAFQPNVVGATCTAGACGFEFCASGFADCSESQPGCESRTSDLATCGPSCNDCQGLLDDDFAHVAGIGCNAASDACIIQSCDPGFRDCDGDFTNGCEVDIKTTTDCGACGRSCSADGTVPNSLSCDASDLSNIRCDFTCSVDFGDCNADVSTGDRDGCETRVENDEENCGACDNACDFPSGVGECQGGNCGLAACDRGTFDCFANDTCVSLLDDDHCGSACTDCSAQANVISSVCEDRSVGASFAAGCAISDCSDPFCDADGDGRNGCELDRTSPRTCAVDCDETPVDCTVAQTNIVGATCTAGGCDYGSCANGFVDCDSGDAGEVLGCESRISALTTCGLSCNNCQDLMDDSSLHVAVSTCNSGADACRIVSCDEGWDDCDNDFTNGCEVNIQTVDDCGSCGRECSGSGVAPGTLSCNAGNPNNVFCDFDCATNFGDCNGAMTGGDLDGCEIFTADDEENCGSCGTECTYADGVGQCLSGICELSACNRGFFDCTGDDTCENLTSEATCGAGCLVCDDRPNVTDGFCQNTSSGGNFSASCQVGSCDLGFCDANGAGNDGCELRLSNPATCAPTCAGPIVDCTATQANVLGATCASGTCGFTQCSAGFVDCTLDAGCESSINSLTTCGVGCNNCQELMDTDFLNVATASCDSANDTCRILTCDAGFEDCNGVVDDGCERSITTTADCGDCGRTCSTNGVASGTLACNSDDLDDIFCEFDCRNTASRQDADCNADEVDGDLDGCEQRVDNNTLNCGECDNECEVTSGIPECIGGVCSLAACDQGFFDCGSDGNCVSLLLDENCGVGCTDCSNLFMTSSASCVDTSVAPSFSAACDITGCQGTFCDFDGSGRNGCEADRTDPRNCAANCNASPVDCLLTQQNIVGPTCTGSGCGYGSCSSGFVDCDMGDSGEILGCESDITALTTCGRGCNDCQALMDDGTKNVSAASCNAGANGCRIDQCDPGYVDCNNNFVDGCETDVTTVSNCGGCGDSCSSQGTLAGSVSCDSSDINNPFCSFQCDASRWGDCDGNLFNGCEKRIDNDVQNCGICERECQFPNAIPACVSGQCEIASCERGFFDCNGDTVCDDLTEVDNCGAGCVDCNAQAGVATAICIEGTTGSGAFKADCEAQTCETNFCLLDGDDSDCESIRLTTQCAPTCGGSVVDCQVEIGGAFGSFCTADGLCDYGTCAVNKVDCNGDRADGCEADSRQAATCGESCIDCTALAAPSSAHASAGTCGGGECVFTCDAGFADCDPNIPGCETDLTDPANCGACGRDCDDEAVGIIGSASCALDPGYTGDAGENGYLCDYSCDATHSDCDRDEFEGDLNGCEERSDNDITNCGGCGIVCTDEIAQSDSVACSNSVCTLIQCDEQYADCDGDALLNGCEIDITTSANCGTCGRTCGTQNTSSSLCVGTGNDGSTHRCDIECQLGFADCNGDPNDGCEVDLAAVGSCGTCNNDCNAAGVVPNGTATCDNGGTAANPVDNFCAVDTCNSGFLDCDSGAAGCETPTSDPRNCGTCGEDCIAQSGGSTNFVCDNSSGSFQCEETACNDGFVDCGLGCQSLDNDNACGSCSTDCDNLTNTADGLCEVTGSGAGISYTCEAGTCDNSFCDHDNNPRNGCEDPSINPLYCGPANCSSFVNCNATVQAASGITCDSGLCDYATCNTDRADCDGNAANGCEATTTNVGTCTAGCYDCGDFVDDVNAGGSSTAPPYHVANVSQCTGSECRFICDSGFANCDAGFLNGCEKSLADTDTCGSCGNDCSGKFANSTGSCGAGDTSGTDPNNCGLGSCTGGYVDADLVLANGCECLPQATDEPDATGINGWDDSNCDGIDGDISDSVFVAIGGTGNCLDPTKPCATIQAGINAAAANGRAWVLIRAGSYDGNIKLTNGVSLAGGYNASWARGDHKDPGFDTSIVGTYDATLGQYVTVNAPGITASMRNLRVEGTNVGSGGSPQRDGTGAGLSSYVIRASGATLNLANLTIVQGNGGNGAAGTAGTRGWSGNAPSGSVGGNSQSGCGGNGGGGGGGASNSCFSHDVSGGNGGRGGNAPSGISCIFNTGAGSGSNGVAGKGSSPGSRGDGGPPNNTGGPGGGGTAGADGSGGTAGPRDMSSVVNGFWRGAIGGTGDTGGNGSGGGGGGGGGGSTGIVLGTGGGSGGGGGGAGGCRAQSSGTGGRSGGSSFGVFATNSSNMSVVSSRFQRGSAGSGGSGGGGADGQPGGSGVRGGTNLAGGGQGGNGTRGGHSGGGGGGAGGVSTGIFNLGSNFFTDANVFASGTGGGGGAGGTATGDDGANGQPGCLTTLAVCSAAENCENICN